jgi:hypothetical protein
MGRRHNDRPIAGFVLFDVLYEDGTRSSNRKIPFSELAGIDGDVPARSYIEGQDRKNADVSGRPPNLIKSVIRSRLRQADTQKQSPLGALQHRPRHQ